MHFQNSRSEFSHWISFLPSGAGFPWSELCAESGRWIGSARTFDTEAEFAVSVYDSARTSDSGETPMF